VPPTVSQHWALPPRQIERYHPSEQSLDVYVESPLTRQSSQAMTQVLQQHNLPITATCKIYWEIWHHTPADQLMNLSTQLGQTHIFQHTMFDQWQQQLPQVPQAATVLVRYIDDYDGKYAIQQLHEIYHLKEINNIVQGVIWQLQLPSSDPAERLAMLQQVLNLYVLYNPYIQECKLIDL
jgi:hypothetical protein